MNGLTPGRTAEPVLRDQILRREWGQGKIAFPVPLTASRIGNHSVGQQKTNYMEYSAEKLMTLHVLLSICVLHDKRLGLKP